MPIPLVTLTTDFGAASPYAAAMKGALLAINSEVRPVDLTHTIPPQDLRYCSHFLRSALPYFPAETIHVVVVDPGVGTQRELLYVETGGCRLLVPDNGCWTELAKLSQAAPWIIRLADRRFWRSEISATFHGRDILAPVAGHLSLGVTPDQLGPPAPTWVEYSLPLSTDTEDSLEGEVIYVDDFGNLITNIAGDIYLKCRGRIEDVVVGGASIRVRPVQTYGEAALDELVMLVSSSGNLEIAKVRGNAAKHLSAGAGTPVRVFLTGSKPRA